MTKYNVDWETIKNRLCQINVIPAISCQLDNAIDAS